MGRPNAGTVDAEVVETTGAGRDAGRWSGLGRLLLGRRRDWAVPRPRWGAITGLAWLGPLAVVASTVAGWFAFAGATGDGQVALGLFVGAASIVLMAWSFLLAIRIRALEPLFGGLDRMYQVHRWAGSLAMVLMFWHVRIEPEIDGGVRGASRAVAEAAEELAGVGEYLLYGLVAISLVRWFPYRWWRLTHKLLGIPFAFACWHFFTAEKTYANGSPWGWYFGGIMVAGLASYLYRVLWRDMVRRGRAYTVASVETDGSTMELELAPKGRPLRHRAGQFAVLKIQERGLSEPHPFTIASSPRSANLRFFIRDLGDWSGRLQREDLVGSTVLVEGPYGRFEPLADHDDPVGSPTLWVAGGVGITPFLSAIDELPPVGVDGVTGSPPVLVYCVGRREDATAIEVLEAAAADGRIVLHVVASQDGRRLTPELLEELVGGVSLQGWHVAACGPQGLLAMVDRTARRLGSGPIESEAFDIRSGVGPDLSRPIDDAVRARRSTSTPVSTSMLPPGSAAEDQPTGPVTDTETDGPSSRKPSSVSLH